MNTENWTPPVNREYLAYRTRKQTFFAIIYKGLYAIIYTFFLNVFFFFFNQEIFAVMDALKLLIGFETLLFLCIFYVSATKRIEELFFNPHGILYENGKLYLLTPRWGFRYKQKLLSQPAILIGESLAFVQDWDTLYSIPDRFKAHPEKLLTWINEHIENNKKSL